MARHFELSEEEQQFTNDVLASASSIGRIPEQTVGILVNILSEFLIRTAKAEHLGLAVRQAVECLEMNTGQVAQAQGVPATPAAIAARAPGATLVSFKPTGEQEVALDIMYHRIEGMAAKPEDAINLCAYLTSTAILTLASSAKAVELFTELACQCVRLSTIEKPKDGRVQ